MPLTQVSSRLIEDTLRYVLGASGTNHYTFTGKGLTGAVNDPTLTLSRGHTYIFENRSGGHPFYIKTSIANGGTNDAYNTGVTNNGGGNGTEIVFTVPHDAPDTMYYKCSSHSTMAGQLSISGSVADGSITESKLADDAVTADKLANSINSAIAANTAKDLTALSASNLTSGTVPDARFPATLPAASAANLTNVPAANITGTLPAISGANLTGISTTPADGSITQAKLNFPVANRNLIINGAMQVAQRGTSSTSTGYQTVDRFVGDHGSTDEAPTYAQVDVVSGTTPYTLGFRKAFKITNGNQTNGFGAGDSLRVDTKLEAQDLGNSGWNFKSSSSYITLSYWVKSSVAQEFFGYLYIDDTPYKYGWSLGSLSADTWTKITVTIPGNSNLGINNDNGVGCWLNLLGIWGTNLTASDAAPNTWAAWDGTKRSTDQATTWYTTNDATFEITGVQLEVGSVATDFEHLSYGEDLAKCERYFHYFAGDTYACAHGSNSFTIFPFHCKMRANPTVAGTYTNGIGNYSNDMRGMYYHSGTSANASNVSFSAEL